MSSAMMPPFMQGGAGGGGYQQGGMAPMGGAGDRSGRSRSPRGGAGGGMMQLPGVGGAGMIPPAGGMLPGMNGQTGMPDMAGTMGQPQMGGVAPAFPKSAPSAAPMVPAGTGQMDPSLGGMGMPGMPGTGQQQMQLPPIQLPPLNLGPLPGQPTAPAGAGAADSQIVAAGQMGTAPAGLDPTLAGQMSAGQMMPGQMGADPLMSNQLAMGQMGMGMGAMGMGQLGSVGQMPGMAPMGGMGMGMGMGQMDAFGGLGGMGMAGVPGMAGMGGMSPELALALAAQQQQQLQLQQIMLQIQEQFKLLGEAEQAAKDNAKKLNSFVGNLARYDDMKGFGFIECPESRQQYGRDIFVLRSRKGDAQEGDIVSFEVEPGDKGLPQAKNILVLKELSQHKKQVLMWQKMYTGALVSPAGSPDEVSLAAASGAKQFVGKVAKYNEEKGWGFLECAETRALYNRNVFVHKDHWPDGLQEGNIVAFQVELNDKGWPQARNIILQDQAS